MEELIRISNINDFLFCPVSIYYHNLMDGADRMLTQSEYQINGMAVHRTVDSGSYSSRTTMLQGIEVFSEEYGITGKIDVFDSDSGILTERKKHVNKLYDGFVFQVYAQYHCLTEMGFSVKRIRIHSIDDNKNYEVPLPGDDPSMNERFDRVLEEMRVFQISDFKQPILEKCARCIYAPMCGNTDYLDDEERF